MIVIQQSNYLNSIYRVLLLLFISSVMSNSLQPQGLQPARLPGPSLYPRVCSNSRSLSQRCHPTILSSVTPSLPAFNLSQNQGLFQQSALPIRWPKYWSFNFIISPSNEYSGLISFRIDWFVFLAVQGTLGNLLQHHGLKASVLQCSVFLWSNSHICT